MASEPEVIRDKTAMRRWSRSHRSKGKTLAFVPTMGFLHEGHLALVRAAGDLADLTVVSIYVNPGQFAPSEDLDAYPADLRGDLYKLADLGVHAVFCPTNLYDYGEGGGRGDVQARRTEGAIGSSGSPVSCLEAAAGDGSGHETWVRVEKLERGLCGMSRPVFFRGVATIVAKLFNIVEPDIAVFGKKDYQQWRIICRMVRDLDFAVKIIGSEIVREFDGLAMSSRNVRLSPEEREKALSIYNSLSKAKYAALHEQSTCQELRSLVIQLVTEAGGRIDYVEIVEQESLIPVEEIDSPAVICIAAWFGAVRLIDNMEINP
ncbi:pantoate--beta-alanine ligase isoform X1 [Musa acuminata AAA Group]|uniref:pantoate--beta-alanine ligase isoform X1 n=1 Tax=Musa acuminata AAA Group TaxID=214697 RepID=UPI0031D77ACD